MPADAIDGKNENFSKQYRINTYIFSALINLPMLVYIFYSYINSNKIIKENQEYLWILIFLLVSFCLSWALRNSDKAKTEKLKNQSDVVWNLLAFSAICIFVSETLGNLAWFSRASPLFNTFYLVILMLTASVRVAVSITKCREPKTSG